MPSTQWCSVKFLVDPKVGSGGSKFQQQRHTSAISRHNNELVVTFIKQDWYGLKTYLLCVICLHEYILHTQIYTHSRHTHEYTNWLSCILISQFRQPSMVTPSSSCWWRILQIKSGHLCQSLQLPDCDGAPCGTSLAASGSRESVVGKCWPTGILATLSLVKIKHIMVILPSIYIYIYIRSNVFKKSSSQKILA